MQSEPHAAFKARLLKRFLYDAMLCALRSSANKEGSLLEIPKTEGQDTRTIVDDLDDESGSMRQRHSKGLFARLKKAKAAKSPAGHSRGSRRMAASFDERELFSLTGGSIATEPCSQSSELISSECNTRDKNVTSSIPCSIINRRRKKISHLVEADNTVDTLCLDVVAIAEEDNDSEVNLEVISIGG